MGSIGVRYSRRPCSHFCRHSTLLFLHNCEFQNNIHHIDGFIFDLQCDRDIMTVLCMRCTRDTKILRPQRCVALNGKPCSACTEDIELEKAINELENQIEKIHTKRRALRTVMNENHDPLIAKFPPEISSQIFIHYAPPVGLFDKNDRSPPFYLGAVCQKWRQLAWRTPQLWTSLFVRFKPYPPQLLAELLERSATLPLAIALSPYSPIIDDEKYLEVINILNRHSSRWHVLHCTLPAHHLHRLCGSLEGNILDRLVLRPLQESTQNPHDRTDAQDVATFSMKCKPSPTELAFAKYRLANVDIGWNRLTTASMEDIGVDECFELMRRAPLLETLALLSIIPSSGTFSIPTSRIVLPRLHWLQIWNVTDEIVVAKILDSMCTPSLKRWVHQIRGDLSSASHMVSFIDQSSFSLKTFKMRGSRDLYSQFHRIFYHLSSLESLELRFWFLIESPIDELLQWLCASDDSSPFLPHLQTLEFDVRFTFPWESLRRIFSSSNRRSLTVKINQTFKQTIPNEVAEKLLELVDEGFDLSVLRDGKVDALEECRQKRHLSQITHQ